MNVRTWGGWVLVVLGIGILMTIGCEKGELGVKSGLVRGVLVDANRPDLRIAGARMVLVSQSSTGGGSTIPTGQMLVAISGPDGSFAFENVRPDSMSLEAKKAGYLPMSWPSASSSASTPSPTPPPMSMRMGTIRAQAAAGTSAVSAIWVTNGGVVDLGTLAMVPTGLTIPDQPIKVKLFMKYKVNNEYIPDDESVSVMFDMMTFTHTAKDWRQGIDSLTNLEITVPPKAGNYEIMVQPDNPDRFSALDTTAIGNMDIFKDILLKSSNYKVVMRPINVPSSIAAGAVMKVFAETILSGNATATKLIATATITGLDTASINLPTTTISGIFLPVNLRFRMAGYSDKIVRLSQENLPAGTQGNIAMDINFSLNDQGIVSQVPDPISGIFQIGMLGNRLTRVVGLKVTGPDFLGSPNNDYAYAYMYGPPTASAPGPDATLTFNNVPVGFTGSYTVIISPTRNPGLASGSFSISGAVNIPVESEANQPPFLIFVNAVRP